MSKASQKQVTSRRVFYIPGYDPIHPRRYRELYRKEGAAQAEISGYQIDLSARQGGDTYGWTVAAEIDQTAVTAEFDVLRWSDIVRDSMKTSIPATYLQLVRTAWIYISTGVLWRLMKLRKGPVIAAVYPVGMLVLQLALAIAIGWVAGTLMDWLMSDMLAQVLPPEEAEGGGRPTAILVGTLVAYGLLRWFQHNDNHFFAYYLMHDYSFSASSRGANPPELETRMAEFADAIAVALQGKTDEVLIVGHSSGAHLAVSIIADLIRAGRVPADGPALSFLSLGQVVPMVSFLPDAHRLRADLHFLSARKELTWVDVTAPGDGCAFALCDPVAVSGVSPEDKKWPLVFSAAFTQSLSPARWQELRWRFFRLHFQYLCAFDRPKDYDYFQITAGPLTLGERYAGRVPSKSRITRAVSKFTSVAA